ncbi:unnamed protein product [Rotaria magnacalcarata]|uniref:Uncharacterized protein n=4 Tax=Rotaria magnacalcarata TaxID=392030 RepID=A0A816VIP9_9BILA|nr:unnamed protein product [Rotaria magnacalcarata]CAF1393485.1 unnamed protein product [Rotaria magnacalcarata]CAF2124229.1 unnamed protein product [Rotaria magnacalcarata]CAF5069695.1 unnamed protein product [Rotaria magnacalcarata]
MDIAIKIFLLSLCLFETVNSKIEVNSRTEEALSTVVPKILANRNLRESKLDDHILVENWQDYVLANAVLANYLNILMVHASKSDFSLLKQSNHCTIYVKTPSSFRQTIVQLSDNIRFVLMNLYSDLNQIQLTLDNFPIHLKTILLLIAKGTEQQIDTHLPNLLVKGETYINESLLILKNPRAKTEQVKDLIVELESLISNVSSEYAVSSQIEDVQAQWILFNDLFAQLAIQAENGIHDFLLQFNWVLEQFIQLNVSSHRDLILNLLKPKVIEIDRTIDLLKIISETSVQISSTYTNQKMTDNTNLILLSNEEQRKEAIKNHRYELQPVAVKFARIALQRHDEFLARTANREKAYEDFLSEMSTADLSILLTLNV